MDEKKQENELIRLISVLEEAGYRVKGIVEKSDVLNIYEITIQSSRDVTLRFNGKTLAEAIVS